MIAIAVDDERWALEDVTGILRAQPDVAEVHPFEDCDEAIAWAKNHVFDVAFLDINMRGIGGIALAAALREINRRCRIVFCTGYSEYMADAFALHADGYVMKPVMAEKIRAELDYINGGTADEKLLTVRCIGRFEVLDKNGTPLKFKRTLTKELLAILVDNRGAGITSRRICEILWADGDASHTAMSYFWNLMGDLQKSLRAAGAEEVIKRNGNQIFIDTDKLSCDWYDHLAAKTPLPENAQYMKGYSWAQK